MLSGIYEAKKNKGTPHCVIPQVSRSWGLLSCLHLSRSLYVCFICSVQAFQLSLVGRLEKSTSTLSTKKCKVHGKFLNMTYLDLNFSRFIC